MPRRRKVSPYLKARRREMWERDPRCHWCGVETIWHAVLPGGHQHPHMATLDHIRSWLDLGRMVDEFEPVVLACYACNHQRGVDRVNALPLEWRRIVARRTPLALPAPQFKDV